MHWSCLFWAAGWEAGQTVSGAPGQASTADRNSADRARDCRSSLGWHGVDGAHDGVILCGAMGTVDPPASSLIVPQTAGLQTHGSPVASFEETLETDTLMTRAIGAVRRSGSLRRARHSAATLCLVLAVAACGGNEISLTEYVESINDAAAVAGARADDITAQGILTEDSTPQEIEAGLERVLEEVRIPLQQSVDAIDPPEQVAELHNLLWSWHADFIEIETTLAARMGATPDTEEGWTMLSDSPEVVAYRASLAEGKQVCTDFQAQLDATEERGAFEGTPWLPSELSEVVNAALGCEAFPEDPQSVYRYPPP